MDEIKSLYITYIFAKRGCVFKLLLISLLTLL